MFESNTDLEFDDDSLQLNSDPVTAPVKRPSPPSSDEPNKRPKLPKNVVKRKFPGPAGLLPERKDFNFSLGDSPRRGCIEDLPCSQMSLSVFQNGPWLEMQRDYETLLERFNIKWIKSKASMNKLQNQKAPFLAAIIHNIECWGEKNSTVSMVLKDTTGEIRGTFLHSLYEEYSESLVIGAVIVLRQFGVLTIGSGDNHHLTVTQNNLVAIYAKKSGDKVGVIKLQNVNCEDLARNTPLKVVNNERVPENGVFDDDFTIPDNFEESLMKENRVQAKKFTFKKPEVVVSCSQISVTTSEESSEMWQNFLEDVDADSLFEDF